MGWVGGNEQLPRKENSPGKINDQRKFIQTDLLWHYYSELFLSILRRFDSFSHHQKSASFFHAYLLLLLRARLRPRLLPPPDSPAQAVTKKEKQEGGRGSIVPPRHPRRNATTVAVALCVGAAQGPEGRGEKSQTKFFLLMIRSKLPYPTFFPFGGGVGFGKEFLRGEKKRDFGNWRGLRRRILCCRRADYFLKVMPLSRGLIDDGGITGARLEPEKTFSSSSSNIYPFLFLSLPAGCLSTGLV